MTLFKRHPSTITGVLRSPGAAAPWPGWAPGQWCFQGAKQETLPVHGEVPPPQPPWEGEGMQAVVCVLGPTWPLPRRSAMFADDADFNIFTLAELFAFTCNYEARHGLFSGPQEGGDVLYSRGVGGEPEALWRGPGWAEPGPSAPQGSCLGLCSTRPPPSHPSTCVVLACSVHPRVGRGVGAGRNGVRAVFSQSLPCVRHCACPWPRPSGAGIFMVDTHKNALTSK